jgi:hypothetical protein
LVDRVGNLPADDEDHLAFILLMVRLGGCVSCNADSFRAMRGCTQCARQTVRRFRGADQDLFEQFDDARSDVASYLKKKSAGESDAAEL